MKIIILCSIFPPEPFVAAQTAISMAKKFSSIGHSVTVITSFPNHPGGKIYDGYKNTLFSKEISPLGFEIIRCFTAPSAKSTFLSRFLENIVFGISSSICLLFLPKVDVIHSDTWPIFATGMMCFVAKLRRIPYLIRVVDLYPESLVSQDRLENSNWAIKFMRSIDKWIAQGANHVIVLTDFFAQVYQNDRKIKPEKISVIPDWIDDDIDCVDEEEVKGVRRKFGIKDEDFLAVYGGNIGVGAGVDILINACRLDDDVKVIIGGGGSELELCRKLANEIDPNRIHFFSPWPTEMTRPLYQSADVLVLPTHKMQSIASIPSKIIRYMLSGQPIIAAALENTELYNLVTVSECGWVIPPDDVNALAKALEMVRQIGIDERRKRGKAGRNYALQNLTADSNLRKVINLINKVEP